MSESPDLLVLGSGPSALVLAVEAANRGMRVSCIAPRPEARWSQNFGSWSDELAGTVAADCVEASWAAPQVSTPRRADVILDRRYARVHTPRLQARLREACADAGVVIERGSAVGISHSDHGASVTLSDGCTRAAAAVVDATGAGSPFLSRRGNQVPGYQTAYGQLIRVTGHPWRCGEMVLMDWSPSNGVRDIDDEADTPSFLYAMPLGWDLLFVEETVLVRRPPTSHWELARRLDRRLERLGIQRVAVLEEEFCTISMGGPSPVLGQRTVGFGAAAGLVHPASGYSLARSLQHAPAVADALVAGLAESPAAASQAAWAALWPEDRRRSWELFRFGMDVLCSLDRDATGRFFDAFFDLPSERWAGFLSATLPPSGVSRAMAELFAHADIGTRLTLMGHGARQPAALLRAVVGA